MAVRETGGMKPAKPGVRISENQWKRVGKPWRPVQTGRAGVRAGGGVTGMRMGGTGGTEAQLLERAPELEGGSAPELEGGSALEGDEGTSTGGPAVTTSSFYTRSPDPTTRERMPGTRWRSRPAPERGEGERRCPYHRRQANTPLPNEGRLPDATERLHVEAEACRALPASSRRGEADGINRPSTSRSGCRSGSPEGPALHTCSLVPSAAR